MLRWPRLLDVWDTAANSDHHLHGALDDEEHTANQRIDTILNPGDTQPLPLPWKEWCVPVAQMHDQAQPHFHTTTTQRRRFCYIASRQSGFREFEAATLFDMTGRLELPTA